MKTRPVIYLGLGILVVAVLVYWVNPSNLIAQTTKISLVSIAGFAGSILAFHFLRSIRWRMILGAIREDPSLKNVFWTNMIGYAVNSFVPVRFGGEVARAYIIDSKEQLGFFPSLSSVAVERILDLLAIVSLAFIAGFGYATTFENASLMTILIITGVFAVAMFILVLVGSRNLPLTMRGINWILGKLPLRRAWRERISGVMQSSLAGATAIGQDYRLLGLTLTLSFLIWVASFLGFYALFLGVGFTAPLAGLLIAIMLFQLSFILPSTPGNVGSFEGFLVLAITALGLGQTDSTLAVGVVSHLVSLLIIGVLGVVGVGMLGLRLKEVFRIPTLKQKASTTTIK